MSDLARTSRFRRLRSDDPGFTLIELILALFLTLIVMTALLTIVVGSLKTVTQARQRQTATALATQSLEQLRALPYATVTGSAPAFPKTAGLQYVVTSGALDTFTPAAVLPGISEELVVNEYSGKRTTSTVDGVNYKVQTYVTKSPGLTGAQQSYNLTSIVSWTSSVYTSVRTVSQRSTLFSPTSCLSSAQHPFSGPCQAFFTVQAGLVSGGVQLSNPLDSTQNIAGFGANGVGLNLPTLSSNLQIEQTATATGNVATARGALGSPATSKIGGSPAVASVDSDPSSVPDQSMSITAPAQGAGSLSASGVAGTLAVTTGGSESGGSRAAIAADATTCKDGDATGTALVTGPSGALRPCASSQVTSGFSGAITYRSPAGLGSLNLASFSGAQSTWRASSSLLGSTNTNACTGAVGAVGCAHGSAARGLSGFSLLSASSGGRPWTGTGAVLSVSNLDEKAVAEQGVGGNNTPVYMRHGIVTVWTHQGFESVDLSNYASAAGSSWVKTVEPSDFSVGLMTVHVEGTVTVNRPTVTMKTPTGCTDESCVSGVNGGAAVRADLRISIWAGAVNSGLPASEFLMSVDLGGLMAQATYKAAPLG